MTTRPCGLESRRHQLRVERFLDGLVRAHNHPVPASPLSAGVRSASRGECDTALLGLEGSRTSLNASSCPPVVTELDAVNQFRSSPTAAIAVSLSMAHGITLKTEHPASM